MSLLDKMRSGSDSTFMQLMLGAVFLAFVASYGRPQGDTKGQIVATVNGSVISDIQYKRALSIEARGRGGSLTDEEREALGELVKKKLITEEVLLQEARKQGFEVSKTEIEHTIAYDPIFADDQGAFDPALYEKRLKTMGYQRPDYEEMVRDQLLRKKLLGVVGDAVDVSDAEVKAAWKHDATKIDITWVRLPAVRFADDVDTSDETVAKYVEANGDRVKDVYDRDFDRLYNVPEKLRVTVIRLPIREDGVSAADLEARIDSLQAQIQGGADMGALAKRFSEDISAGTGGAKPPVAVADFEPAVSEALGKVQPGQLTKVVTARDVWLYRLEERLPARVIGMDEVKNDIAKQILRDQGAPGKAADFATKVVDAWKATGSVPTALLAEEGIVPETSGLFAPSEGLGRMGPPADILEKLYDAPVGPPTDFAESAKTYWISAVTTRIEPDDAEFDAQKVALREDVRSIRRASFARAWTDDLVARAKVQ